MRRPRPLGLTRDRAPGKPEGWRQTLRTQRLSARRGDDSVQVVSPWAYQPRGPQSRAQAGSASPAVLGRQPSLQRLEAGARVHRDPSRLCRQQLRQAGSRRIQEEPESSSRLQRLVNLPPSKAQGGARARAGVRACVCPDTHVPPTQACFYLLAEAATGAMAAKDAEPADRAPHGGTAARARARRMATEGQEARQPPRLGLITTLPQVRAQILSGFSFSRQTPCGGAGTLASAQSLDIYIFLGWFLSLAGKETNP